MNKLAFFILILICVETAGQNADLFENPWYLQLVEVDGVEYFPPTNSEVDSVDLFIEIDSIETIVCNGYGSGILSIDNTSFTLDVLVKIPLNCSLPQTLDFEDVYIDGFYLWTLQGRTFDYEIQTGANDLKTLIITNENGDVATYGNQILQVNHHAKERVMAYFNPINKTLSILDKDHSIYGEMIIYDIGGAEVADSMTVTNVDLQFLSDGIYVAKVTKMGKTYFLKLVVH